MIVDPSEPIRMSYGAKQRATQIRVGCTVHRDDHARAHIAPALAPVFINTVARLLARARSWLDEDCGALFHMPYYTMNRLPCVNFRVL